MPGKPWSPDEIGTLTEALIAGSDLATIEARLPGRSPVAIVKQQRDIAPHRPLLRYQPRPRARGRFVASAAA